MARRGVPEPQRRSATIDIVSRMQRVEAELSPAERRVAEIVPPTYEAATRMTIAELAARADVSQPTVTRFCRSVGCASFSEFKISLATTLTVAAAYLKSDRVFDDDVGQLAQTIMMRAAGAVREVPRPARHGAVAAAIDALAASRRIDLYGQGGGSAAMVEDAKLRLFRLGIPVSAYRRRPPAAHVGGDAPAGRRRASPSPTAAARSRWSRRSRSPAPSARPPSPSRGPARRSRRRPRSSSP